MVQSSTSGLEKAFQRHSRPQRPTLSTEARLAANRRSRLLLIHSSPSWTKHVNTVGATSQGQSPTKETIRPHEPQSSQWIDFIQLGKLVQGDSELTVCLRRKEKARLVTFKEIGQNMSDKVRVYIGLQCGSIVTASDIIQSDIGYRIGSNYTRFTLEELLSTHMRMDEPHIQGIASMIFPAIKYLQSQDLCHRRISARSVRVCGMTGFALLGDCEECESTKDSCDEATGVDLDDFGLTLLQCMEGSSQQSDRTALDVRQERATNKVFGLRDAERWSGHKQLINCLDDLFGNKRKVQMKLQKPHEYLTCPMPPGILIPLTELASLECFAVWHPIG